jgi:hypothetical protein
MLAAACGSAQPKAATTLHHTQRAAATSTTAATTPPTSPPTTAPPPPPTTTTTAPVAFPPQGYSGALALAGTGSASALDQFNTKTFGSGSCDQIQYDVVAPAGASSQALAADLLAFYFSRNPPSCGGVSIDAYNSQSDANANSSSGGEATAGNLQLIMTNGQRQVLVSIVSPSAQFSFSY